MSYKVPGTSGSSPRCNSCLGIDGETRNRSSGAFASLSRFRKNQLGLPTDRTWLASRVKIPLYVQQHGKYILSWGNNAGDDSKRAFLGWHGTRGTRPAGFPPSEARSKHPDLRRSYRTRKAGCLRKHSSRSIAKVQELVRSQTSAAILWASVPHNGNTFGREGWFIKSQSKHAAWLRTLRDHTLAGIGRNNSADC